MLTQYSHARTADEADYTDTKYDTVSIIAIRLHTSARSMSGYGGFAFQGPCRCCSSRGSSKVISHHRTVCQRAICYPKRILCSPSARDLHLRSSPAYLLEAIAY